MLSAVFTASDVSPKPSYEIGILTPRLRNHAAIERARSCDSLKLCVGLPTVSVWPAT
jgi:hypothetical protein